MSALAAPSFGALLRRYRVAAHLTQEELAERAGLSPRAVIALERGERRKPYRQTIALLAIGLQLSSRDTELLQRAAGYLSGAQAGQAGDADQLPVGGFLGAIPPGPIVAREEQLERVLFAADVVEAGTGQLVLLVGEQGVGKTRLAQEVFLQVRNLGFLVSTGRCSERTSRIPFCPFLEALMAASAAAPPDIRARAAKEWPHLERLLSPRADDRPMPAPEGEVEQQQFFRAVASFLTVLAQERPVALLFDDLHWADQASLDLLEQVARQTRGQRVLLLGAYCDTDVDQEHPLGRAIRHVAREGLVERVAVRRLMREGTAALVTSLLGPMAAAEEFVDFVHHRTRGNPFFIGKMLEAVGGATGWFARLAQAVWAGSSRLWTRRPDSPLPPRSCSPGPKPISRRSSASNRRGQSSPASSIRTSWRSTTHSRTSSQVSSSWSCYRADLLLRSSTQSGWSLPGSRG